MTSEPIKSDDDIDKLLAELDDYERDHQKSECLSQKIDRRLNVEDDTRRKRAERQRFWEELEWLDSPEMCNRRLQEKIDHFGDNRSGGFFMLDGWAFHETVHWTTRAVLSLLRRDAQPFYRNQNDQWTINKNGRQVDCRQYSFLSQKQLASWVRQPSGYDFTAAIINNLSDSSSPFHTIISHSPEGFFHLKPVYGGLRVSQFLMDNEILSPDEKDFVIRMAWNLKMHNSKRVSCNMLFDGLPLNATLKNAVNFIAKRISAKKLPDSFRVSCKVNPNNQIYRMFLDAAGS